MVADRLGAALRQPARTCRQWRRQKVSTGGGCTNLMGGASICSIPSSILAQLPHEVGLTIAKRHDMNRLYEQLHVTGHWTQ